MTASCLILWIVVLGQKIFSRYFFFPFGYPCLFLELPGWLSGKKKKKNPAVNAGDTGDGGSIPGSGRSPRVGNGNPLQDSCLENPMERGALWTTVLGCQTTGAHTSCFRGRSCFLCLQVLCSLKCFASHQFKLLLLQSLLIIIYNKWFFLNYFAVSAF